MDTGTPYDQSKQLQPGQSIHFGLDQTQQPDIQTGGMNLPGAPKSIQTISRPSFLSAFLSNLGPALAGSMQAPRGSGVAGGLAGGFAGISKEEHDRLQEQFQQQQLQMGQESQQRLAEQAKSQEAFQSAQLKQLQEMGPLQAEHEKLTNSILKGQAEFYGNPENAGSAIDKMFAGLGKLSPDEQALKESSKIQVQQSRKLDSAEQNVQKIYLQRQMMGRSQTNPQAQAFQAYQALASGQTPATLHGDPKDIIAAFQKLQKDLALPRVDMMMARGNIMAIPVLDEQGNQTFLSANQILGNTGQPKPNVAPASAGAKAMQSQRLLDTVGASVDEMEKQLPNLSKLSEGDKILINKAMMEHGESTWGFLKASGAVSNLSAAGKQYVAVANRLAENLPSLRGSLGQGQTSDARINRIMSSMSGALVSLDPGMAKQNIQQMRSELGQAKKMFPKDITAGKDSGRVIDLRP